MNLFLRILSAFILIPVFLSFFYLGGIYLAVLLLFVWFLGCFELYKILNFPSLLDSGLRRNDTYIWLVFIIIILYISLGIYSALALREYFGFYAVLLVLSSTILSDTGAYFSGRLFGKHKLAPKISPKKTWEGFFGGALACVLIPYLFKRYFINITPQDILWTCLPIALLAPLGDLLESYFKRKFNIKDSGNIIPGHGGVLDRVDSLLLTLPYTLLYFTLK